MKNNSFTLFKEKVYLLDNSCNNMQQYLKLKNKKKYIIKVLKFLGY